MNGAAQPCPCGSGVAYPRCCGRYLDGPQEPETAEGLMRSRYTAYVLRRDDYLLASWHPSTRPDRLELDAAGAVSWRGLKLLRVERGGADDAEGVVEFVARFKPAGPARRLHEVSRFRRERGRWFYVDGDRRQ